MVLFFDSGVGGLAYLDAFHRLHPEHATLYLADTAFFPYGERAPEDVRNRVVSLITAAVSRYPIDAVVIACNTASVVALAAVRERVGCPVVGVVPAVKPAAATTRSNHIAVLSTVQTASDPYTDDLIERFAGVAGVTRLGLPRLVDAAERSVCPDGDVESAASIETIVREDIAAALPGDVDTVVLACTHFIRIREVISRVLGPAVTIVDSVDGVVRRLIDVINAEDNATASAPSRGVDSAARRRSDVSDGASGGASDESAPLCLVTSDDDRQRFACLGMDVASFPAAATTKR